MQIFYNLNWGGNGRISVDAVWLLKVSTAAPVNGKSPDDVDIRVVRAGFYTVGCGSPLRDYEPKLSKRMFSGGFGSLVGLEVCLVEDVVHESHLVCNSCSIGLGILTVEGQMELEVGEVALYLVEVLEVEGLFQAAGPLSGCGHRRRS